MNARGPSDIIKLNKHEMNYVSKQKTQPKPDIITIVKIQRRIKAFLAKVRVKNTQLKWDVITEYTTSKYDFGKGKMKVDKENCDIFGYYNVKVQ